MSKDTPEVGDVWQYKTDDNLKFVLYEQLAEYQTWQEAVNSKEFRGE